VSERDSHARVGKLVVVGVGLIGGSFALALRARNAVREVVGIGRSRANLDAALKRGIVDRAATLDEPWQRELEAADVVLVATPVAQMPGLLAAIAPRLERDTVITDAGSTKRDVAAAARATLGAVLPRFVPGHPIAGAEQSGSAAATATLFRDRHTVLTPLPETGAAAVTRIGALWETCGARVSRMDVEQHDRILGAVSHLPHVLAYAFVGALARRSDGGALFALAGSGFRDFTRIAGSSPEMWRDIMLANRDVVLDELAQYRDMLSRYAQALQQENAALLLELLTQAAQARRALKSLADAPGTDDA